MNLTDKSREEEVKRMIIQTLQAARMRLNGHKVVLFGSRAKRKSRLTSDFDIGVIGSEPLPLRDFYAIEDMFDALPTLYRIDFVDIARTSERFRSHALKDVETLYE
jgi:predicted nucleotidyltransferase